MFLLVCVCVLVHVEESKYSVAMASALSTGMFFTARAGLGSSWVARRNSIHTFVPNYLSMDHSAPLLTGVFCIVLRVGLRNFAFILLEIMIYLLRRWCVMRTGLGSIGQL